jgi:KDO2-lipid IV(A) lauroyltransferase
MGLEIILPRGAVGEMVKAVQGGGVVFQLIDQVVPADKGVFVPFFGRRASTTPAVSLAAARSGAPVFVMMAVRDGARLRSRVEGPIPLPSSGDQRADIATHTAELTAHIERIIRQHPDQWLWLHRRWKVSEA